MLNSADDIFSLKPKIANNVRKASTEKGNAFLIRNTTNQPIAQINSDILDVLRDFDGDKTIADICECQRIEGSDEKDSFIQMIKKFWSEKLVVFNN